MKYHHLSFEERFVIEVMLKKKTSIRYIAEYLGRSANTVSREIKKNSTKGSYDAKKAHHKAYLKRWRSKTQCLKVAMNDFLYRYVDKKLREKWSPEQISGELKYVYGITCSPKAIYKFAQSRCLERYLFWGWNKRRGNRENYHYDTPKDDRKYIDLRPMNVTEGDWEMDFIVSSLSTYVLLVIVNRVTKYTKVLKLPNRKRTTVMCALSVAFRGESVRSITTDNDIAFVCWKDIESLLHTRLYFTHPYHSWEKGLVENTNRWIRCFVPKKQDIASVTKEDLQDMDSFLNNRPRKIIGFRTPSVYHRERTVLLRG
jgi:transposase, IS30 family